MQQAVGNQYTMPQTSFQGNIQEREIVDFRAAILHWYDRERRTLPWRAAPGERAQPYRVWLSEIMLQQTTVPAVIPYFLKFIETWPSVRDLAAAQAEEVLRAWAGLGYYARARNLHKCAAVVAQVHGGVFPDTEEGLRALPGIGPYTAAAIAAIAFDRPATVVDGNVERVAARYFAVTDPLPRAKAELSRLAGVLSEGRMDRPGDFAQAMMDLGATVCTPRAPRCGLCPLSAGCRGREMGIAERLPARAAKAEKPRRKGFVYLIRDGRGNVLLERRPAKGLLGGMTGLPTSAWTEETPAHPACLAGLDPCASGVRVSHVFTHFHLELEGFTLTLPPGSEIPEGAVWISEGELAGAGLPSVFLKAVRAFGLVGAKVA